MNREDCILFSGGAPGAEAAFGECAERHGIEEVNFTFEGHPIARQRGVRVLNHEELQAYISGCYGTLTSFNVLFADADDQFKGAAGD